MIENLEIGQRILRLPAAQRDQAIAALEYLRSSDDELGGRRLTDITIIEAMHDPALFGPWFEDRDSWLAWEVLLKALFGLEMTTQEIAVFHEHTGRDVPPSERAREAWFIIGRRGGKSRIAALIAVYLSCFRDYRQFLSPGEVGTFAVIAADRAQARSVMRYIAGFLDAVPLLQRMLVGRSKESIELSNRVTIEVRTASLKTTRGYTLIGVICDEIAFWQTDDGSANPDVEILNSLRPGMTTIPGAILLGMSSPYARRGVLWDVFTLYFGKDSPVLVWRGDTRSMNPAVDQAIIDAAFAEDEAAASAEYGAEFRRDIESFVAKEIVDACVVTHLLELPPVSDCRYVAFVDPSGGSQDSFTLAIAHREVKRLVLDCVREKKAPFSPADTVRELVAVLKTYRVFSVTGDRYAGEWPREKFREHGVTYEVADKTRSDLYRDLLPALTSRTVQLLDDPTLSKQLCRLERRTTRAGKDSIDHPPGGHDDVANAVAGVIAKLGSVKPPPATGPLLI